MKRVVTPKQAMIAPQSWPFENEAFGMGHHPEEGADDAVHAGLDHDAERSAEIGDGAIECASGSQSWRRGRWPP
jgi:hypothetical protein